MFKKRSIIAIILAFILVFFVACNGDEKTIDKGMIENSSVTSSGESLITSFADSGLMQELPTEVSVQLSATDLERQDDSGSVLTRSRKSVVEVYSILDGAASAGSGVFVAYIPDAEGEGGTALVLTCHHVIDSAYAVNIRDINGNVSSAGLIGSDPNGDIAILWSHVNAPVTCAPFGVSSDAQVGETVYAIGNPTGTLGGTVTKGIISATQRSISFEGTLLDVMQIDAAINAGSSGGGLFTEDGYLIGMTNGGVTYQDGLGFAIPSDIIIEKANALISTYRDETYNSYGYIPGVVSYGVTLGTNYYGEVGIASMTSFGSFGSSGQLEVNDKIVSLKFADKNGNEQVYQDYNPSYSAANEMMEWIKSCSPTVGDTLTLNIIRSEYNDKGQLLSSQELEVTITFIQLIYQPVAVPENVLTEEVATLTASMGLNQFADINSFFLESSSLVRTDDEDSELSLMRKSVTELYGSANGSSWSGSAVFVGFSPNEQGQGGIAYILTCHHCVEGANVITITDYYGNTYETSLIGSDKMSDVALLWAEIDYTPTVAQIASSTDLQVGNLVYAIGNPTGELPGTVTKGIVSALSRDISAGGVYMTLLQVDVAINGGSSGGGLFSEEGYLVGLVNSGINYQDGLGFAVPSDTVYSVITSLLNTYKNDVYGTFGYVEGRVDVYSIEFEDASMGFFGYNVVYVSALSERSAFYRAGLRERDIINTITVGDKVYNVTSASDLTEFLSYTDFKLGDKITFQYTRRNTVYKTTVTLSQYIYIPA